MKTHRDLAVWNESMNLVVSIYSLTRSFPKEEMYGLTSQIRRAVVSVPANISEGAARKYTKEYLNFLRISLGSLSELETLVLIAWQLNYLKNEDHQFVSSQIKRITILLSGLIKSLEQRSIRG
jgi:four helix bundle protein